MVLLRHPKLIFWDFDGVIKDSVEVKTHAFVQLFQRYGPEVAKRVRAHHEANGGMSRFDKIPRYLEWGGDAATPELVDEYCQRFAQLVRQSVIDAPWVPGAEALLRNKPHGQIFVLVTATPQGEMEEILNDLNLRSCFAAIYGAPTSKIEAIRATLAACQIAPQHCMMIGDARADWDAAKANQVPFLLRLHGTNGQVFEHYTGDSVKDFTDL